ncbi:MAG: hypothetical protein LBQ78_00770 [Tannerellaceae bacterium]|jgi:hypothetical protein|nr:hypothetical protein [Tannerellaceae bacterium]
MDHNFFIKISSGILLPDKRLREHIDFCKRALESADFPQYQMLCLSALAGSYREAGDAVSAREVNIKVLERLDAEKEIIYKAPSLQEVMEDMYVTACEAMGQYAISYSEYETYMNKIKEVRPLTEQQAGQLELVENLKNEGRDWTYNILALANRYQDNTQFEEAMALYSLLFIYRRQLRVSRENINLAIHNYTANVLNLISGCIAYCEENGDPCNPYNYLFIIEKAITLVSEFQKDMSTKKEADDAIESLTSLKNAFEEELQEKGAEFYDYYSSGGYMSPKLLEDEIRNNETMKKMIPPGFEPATEKDRRAAAFRSVIALIFAWVCVYWASEVDETWKMVALYILSFFGILSAVSMYSRRKIKRKRSMGMEAIIILLAISAGGCNMKRESIDIAGKDIRPIIAEDISKQLSQWPLKNMIFDHKPSAIITPENVFLEILKEQVADDAVLHPDMTYLVTYGSGLIKAKKEECEAMAYSIVRDGKLYDDGLVLSVPFTGKTNTTGYTKKARFDYTIITWIVIGLLLVFVIRYSRYITKKGKAYIVRAGLVETPFSRKLRIAIGKGTMLEPFPLSVDIKFVYADRYGDGQLALAHVSLQENSSIAVGEIAFPTPPHTKPFICKAWVISAHYASGEVWKNTNAYQEEDKARRFFEKKQLIIH